MRVDRAKLYVKRPEAAALPSPGWRSLTMASANPLYAQISARAATFNSGLGANNRQFSGASSDTDGRSLRLVFS